MKLSFDIELGLADQKAGKPVGMNHDLADGVLWGDNPTTYKYPKCSNLAGLNEEQASFVNCALKYSYSYLWGPPGTGKTQALGALISEFFKHQERSLICSTTNQAVDQVLLKLCRTLKKARRIGDLEAGKIVRVGRIQQSELMEEFSGYITVDGIANRRSSELTQELKKCEAELAKEEEAYLKFEHTIQSYEHLQGLEQDFISDKKEFDRNFNRAKELQQDIETSQHRADELQLEIENYSSKGLFGRMVSKNPENIGAEKRQLEGANLGKLTVLNELKPLVLKQKESLESQKREIDRIKKQLGGHDLTRVLEAAENISEKIDSVRAKITEIKKKIDEISKTILSEATIVGATLTKTYLSPSDLGKYQNIIIDEASMGFIPAIYFTASQSEKRCIISGDFRQLPPIVPTNSKEVDELIGLNIFDHAGLEEQFEAGTNPDNARVLTKQYRMDPKICDLVSNIGYEGLLKTAPERVSQSLPALEGLDDSIIIIDTSPFYPFCQRDPYNSTSNVTHALIARNLIRQLGKSINMGSVGYCAPFKAQTKLLKRMVDDDLDNPSAIGTVHTYQGDEKDTIIFDTVQSLGEKYALSPNLSQELARHSQLLTVAVTRAKERLIFVANLKYLDSKIPANGYLRSILASVQANGIVVDARKIIDLAPLQNEILSYTPNLKELGIPDNALENGLVNEDSFYPLLNVDIENAKKYIAIYSGFYAPERVSKLLPILKSKIEEGIKIRIIIPPPSKNGSIGETDSRALVDIMRQAGVLVELRGRIHQKAVLLDESIVWFGSLNPLSFSGATEESMWRIEKEGITGIVGANMAVNRLSAKDDPKLIVQRELHDCSHCGSLVAFYRGKFGDYVSCIACNQAEKFRVKSLSSGKSAPGVTRQIQRVGTSSQLSAIHKNNKPFKHAGWTTPTTPRL